VAREIANTVAALWGMTTYEWPNLAYVDFTFLDGGQPVELVEVKARRNRFDAYRDYMIGLDKWRGIQQLMAEHNLPAILLVRFTDCVAWTQITNEPWLVREGGRTDRRDALDKGPMAYTPMRRFHKV
jgi:hypothetical protein